MSIDDPKIRFKHNIVTREQCIDNFIEYIKNDLLGEVANLHSRLADQHRDAIKSSECLELAEMHSKAVDYQKHGEMLDVDRFNELQRENNFKVDFMSQETKLIKKNQIKESPGVLGQMFRALKGNIDQKDFLKIEYDLKIMRDYKLSPDVLQDKRICEHLCFIYKNVVVPYCQEIRKIMEEKNLFTESDIFNVNCAFSNIINSRDEKYGHEADIELIIQGLQDQLR